MIHVDDTVGVIHGYQTASPELIIKDESYFGSKGIAGWSITQMR